MNMYSLVVIVVAIASAQGTGSNSRALKQYPSPVPNFNVNMFLGNWYYYAGRASCSWDGLNDFSDLSLVYTPTKKGMLTAFNSRYRGDCAVTYVKQTFDPRSPAITKYSDKIGGLVAGTKVVVATDYKSFCAEWGCAQPAVDGSCKDPWIAIRTRKPKPGPATMHMISKVLFNTWGMHLGDLVKMQNNNPCQQPMRPQPRPMVVPIMPPPRPMMPYKKGK